MCLSFYHYWSGWCDTTVAGSMACSVCWTFRLWCDVMGCFLLSVFLRLRFCLATEADDIEEAAVACCTRVTATGLRQTALSELGAFDLHRIWPHFSRRTNLILSSRTASGLLWGGEKNKTDGESIRKAIWLLWILIVILPPKTESFDCGYPQHTVNAKNFWPF